LIDHLPTDIALSRELDLLDRVSHAPDQRLLWVWQGTQSLVVPRKLAVQSRFTQAAADLAAQGWPVHTRSTGGDATPQGPGIVNVTHVYALPRTDRFDLDREYGRLCAPIETALGPGATRGWQPGAFCDGAHNVQFNGLKFAGTAMRFRPSKADRGRVSIMAHALMLMDPPRTDAIDAINHLLGALDQDRSIAQDAHTGLPPGDTPDRFLSRLVAAFKAQADLAPLTLLNRG
jgi:lipoate-protein ligase A